MTRRRQVVLGASVILLMGVICALMWLMWPPHVPADGDEGQPPERASGPVANAASGADRSGAARAIEAPRPAAGRRERVDGGVLIASFGWGAGNEALGRSRPREGNPEGPMSLTVDSRGTTWILDQQNGRIVKVSADGSRGGTVPLPLQAPQDLAVAKDGTAVVMDRLADKSIALLNPDGTQKGELHLLGKGMPEGGASSGLFTDGKDVLVEREHGDSVKIGGTDGVNDPQRPEVPGRPTRDGKSYLTAGIANAASGEVTVTVIDRPGLALRFTRQLRVGPSVVSLLLLDADSSGILYLGALTATAQSTQAQPQFEVAVVCLDPTDGRPLGRVTLPPNAVGDEAFRELSLADDGAILYLHRTEEGSQLIRATCP